MLPVRFHAMMTSLPADFTLYTLVCFPSGYTPRSSIAVPCDSSRHRVWKKCHVAFHVSWTIVHSDQQETRGPISPHPHLNFFFNTGHPNGVNSLQFGMHLPGHVEHLFTCY